MTVCQVFQVLGPEESWSLFVGAVLLTWILSRRSCLVAAGGFVSYNKSVSCIVQVTARFGPSYLSPYLLIKAVIINLAI